MEMTSDTIRVIARGSFGFDQSLAYRGTAIFSKELSDNMGKGSDFLKDGDGRAHIPFSLEGTISKPRISIDANDLVARYGKWRLKKEIGGKFLDKLLK